MELVNIVYRGQGIQSQTYSGVDEVLITNNYLNVVFGNPNDYIESFIYDDANQLLESDYLLERYSPNSSGAGNLSEYSSVTLDPKQDINDKGYTRGSLNIQYNFLRNLFNSSYTQRYWIKDISSSRTELKLTSQNISDSGIKAGFDNYQAYAQSKNYYSDFYLNFGNNELIIAINVAYTEDENGAYILIKLYEPLPIDYDIKTSLWMVDKIAESVIYNVDIQVEADAVVSQNALRGPNFKIAINDKVGQTTPYYNYQNLFSSNVSSSFQQLMSYFDDKAIAINVDYSDFSNFIHFSSAAERLNNYVYKLKLIESYNAQIGAQISLSGGGATASSSIGLLTQSIDNITKKFDTYEYYLYYSSESFAWPKSTSTKPYKLYSVTSSQAVSWLGSETTPPNATSASVLYSASLFDATNKDLLTNTIPQYLQDDENNQPYVTFLNMVGQHFDNIWIYYKDVTNRYNNTNNPNTGISIDMVADALRGLGTTLYTNTNLSNDLYYSLFGIQANGSLLPPTGSELITKFVTSSIPTIAPTQLEKEVYKRIYHNIPYLLKTKGTHRGVKALVACYGIPEDILTINEFGGVNRYQESGIYEANNNKVDVDSGSLQISSSLLSPYTTIQYHNTDNRMDIERVEVGFSPSNTINKEISSSLGYFNIDQYIGAPSNQYSSSYNNLDTLSKSYFSAYTNKHNVNEYVRLIKFYNNSLFKMIKDFVPARADLATGIIIKPHILERNKYKRQEPNVITSSYDTDIEVLTISATDAPELKYTTQYTESIQSISGLVDIIHNDSYEKYTGEFGGTVITPNLSYCSQSEHSYQPGSNIAPIQVPMIATYQNVSSSIKSTRFFDLDYSTNQSTPVNLNIITESINQGPISQLNEYAPYAQIQDYNYSVRRSVIPRYSGSYLSGKYYNTHSIGDVSYGKEPVINRYTNKLGLFTQVDTSSFLPGKVNVSLGYLVDVQGGLFELNQQNTSWQDIQNIFKTGTSLTIKQFDNKKFSNQKSTDGVKKIFESGYSYTPQLYYTSGSDSKLYFQYVGGDTATLFLAFNGGSPNNYISGSGLPYYPVVVDNPATRAGNIYNIFDSASVASPDFATGSAGIFANYTSSIAEQKVFDVKLGIYLKFLDPSIYPIESGSFTWGAYRNSGTTLVGNLQKVQFTSSYNDGSPIPGSINYSATTLDTLNTSFMVVQAGLDTIYGPLDMVEDGILISPNIGTTSDFITFDIIQMLAGPLAGQEFRVISSMSSVFTNTGLIEQTYYVNTSNILSFQTSTPQVPSSISDANLNINYTTPATSYGAGEEIVFKFRQDSMSTDNYTASVSYTLANSSLEALPVAAGQGNYPFATSSFGNFIYDIVDIGTEQSDIILSNNLTQFINYEFIPYFISGSTIVSSSLYDQYGDINDVFNPQYGDKVIMTDINGITQDVNVLYSEVQSGKLHIYVVPQVLANWVNNSDLIEKLLILKRYNDEQSVILTFNKNTGATSYGFIIPENINPNVLANINTIQSAVQSQILSSQVNTGN